MQGISKYLANFRKIGVGSKIMFEICCEKKRIYNQRQLHNAKSFVSVSGNATVDFS